MKYQISSFLSSIVMTDRRVIRLILLIISIVLFGLGAGAPDAGGGIGIQGVPGFGG